MLDRSKLISELERVAQDLFVDDAPAESSYGDIWRTITQDPFFLHKVQKVVNPPWPVPLWEGNLGDTLAVERATGPHVVFSVDGSQIYPDRHHAIFCFLINTG